MLRGTDGERNIQRENRKAKFKKGNAIGEEMEPLEPSHLANGSVEQYKNFKKLEFLIKVKHISTL